MTVLLEGYRVRLPPWPTTKWGSRSHKYLKPNLVLVLSSVIAFLMLATLVSLPSAYGEKFQRNLVEGELDKYDLAGRGMGPGDNLKVDFTFAAQGMGDVYILTEVEYEYLKDNRGVNPYE